MSRSALIWRLRLEVNIIQSWFWPRIIILTSQLFVYYVNVCQWNVRKPGSPKRSVTGLYKGQKNVGQLMFLRNWPPTPPLANINTYFSPGEKCWLRGGVGGQFPRNLNWSKNLILTLYSLPNLKSGSHKGKQAVQQWTALLTRQCIVLGIIRKLKKQLAISRICMWTVDLAWSKKVKAELQ